MVGHKGRGVQGQKCARVRGHKGRRVQGREGAKVGGQEDARPSTDILPRTLLWPSKGTSTALSSTAAVDEPPGENFTT